MKYLTIFVALLALSLIAAGCRGETKTEQPTTAEFSVQESSDTMNSVDQSFINESDEVEIGEMV